MGSDISQTVREGIITANLTKSAKCMQYLEEQPETDILNLDFKKEQVVVSFFVEHTSAWKEDVKNDIQAQLEKVFNSVSVLEKISFLQLQQINMQKLNAENTKNMNLTGDSHLHLIDFQILLQYARKINYNLTLEESIIKGLELTARVF